MAKDAHGRTQSTRTTRRESNEQEHERPNSPTRHRADRSAASTPRVPPLDGAEGRPTYESLGALSEYEARTAAEGSDESVEAIEELARPPVAEEDDLTPPRMATAAARQGGPPHEDDLTVAPDELGASYLRGAVQDSRVTGAEEEELPAEEDLVTQESEQRLLEQVAREFEVRDGIVQHLPDGSDREQDLSEVSIEAVRWARARGARTHAEVRKKAGEYLNRRAERLAAGAGEP